MDISHVELVEVLKSQEYAPYLLFKGNDKFIDFKNIPKNHYLDLDSEVLDGLVFSQRLNQAYKTEGDLIKLEAR